MNNFIYVLIQKLHKKQSPDNNIQSEYYIKALFSLEPCPSASKLDLLRIVLYVIFNELTNSKIPFI